MDNYDQKLGIKTWAEADRPREKLLLQGRRQLTDAELIAILIGSGSRNETAVDLSKRILNFYKNDLAKVAKLSVKELSKFKGIGQAKAISIVAALELGRRRKETEKEGPLQITSSKDAYEILKAELSDLPHEEFWILILNRANFVTGKHFVSKGGQSGTVVDPKVIFKVAIENNAASIVLAHNHPSGNLRASSADISITKNLVQSGLLLEIPIYDHLIITDHSYLSLADEGLM
ncbi:DNA repair protein RadC [Pedobacter frigiditerrae]|uniref:DNA repair protein RadC n=1 Tax=Pedobacter frigiditerrae TaxID=2530452 RepID=A0A4R0MKB0_9SPHI|nr:DNA repair protein RadC [Pedobacter frigiditerrae]TCC87050.1 DNA repair protein RadC [Pedobacter frigiditerrae]